MMDDACDCAKPPSTNVWVVTRACDDKSYLTCMHCGSDRVRLTHFGATCEEDPAQPVPTRHCKPCEDKEDAFEDTTALKRIFRFRCFACSRNFDLRFSLAEDDDRDIFGVSVTISRNEVPSLQKSDAAEATPKPPLPHPCAVRRRDISMEKLFAPHEELDGVGWHCGACGKDGMSVGLVGGGFVGSQSTPPYMFYAAQGGEGLFEFSQDADSPPGFAFIKGQCYNDDCSTLFQLWFHNVQHGVALHSEVVWAPNQAKKDYCVASYDPTIWEASGVRAATNGKQKRPSAESDVVF